jgi:hypothetical protein
MLVPAVSDDRKRPSSMSDADRALAGRDRRITPPRGLPADSFEEDDHFTPVTQAIEHLDDLTDRERMLFQLVWRHTANMEMRARKRSDSSETSTLARRIDALETAIVDIRGENGGNGKLGEVTRRVDKAEARRWWAITALAGLLVTVISSAIALGSWMGSIETDVATLKARSMRRNQPDTPADRTSP